MNKVLFIGGPGNISRTTVEDVLSRKFTTALFTNEPNVPPEIKDKAEIIFGDRNDKGALKAVADRFKPDIVCDFVCFSPNQAREAVEIFSDKIEQYIFISTVDVYGYPLHTIPQSENDPWVPTITQYAEDKKTCEEIFTTADRGKFPITIARPSYSFGKGFLLHFTSFGGIDMLKRLQRKKPVIVPGDGTTLLHASAAPNTGLMIAKMIGHYPSVGKSYTCGHHRILTQDQYITEIASVVGEEPVIEHIPSDVILKAGGKELQGCPITIHLRQHIAFSVDAFSRDFPDFHWPWPLKDAIKLYIDANQKELATEMTETVDDRIIKSWHGYLETLPVK